MPRPRRGGAVCEFQPRRKKAGLWLRGQNHPFLGHQHRNSHRRCRGSQKLGADNLVGSEREGSGFRQHGQPRPAVRPANCEANRKAPEGSPKVGFEPLLGAPAREQALRAPRQRVEGLHGARVEHEEPELPVRADLARRLHHEGPLEVLLIAAAPTSSSLPPKTG